MEITVKRLCITSKDIARITGLTPRQARNVLNDIKVFYKKEKHQSVSFKEYAQRSGLSLEDIEKFIFK